MFVREQVIEKNAEITGVVETKLLGIRVVGWLVYLLFERRVGRSQFPIKTYVANSCHCPPTDVVLVVAVAGYSLSFFPPA